MWRQDAKEQRWKQQWTTESWPGERRFSSPVRMRTRRLADRLLAVAPADIEAVEGHEVDLRPMTSRSSSGVEFSRVLEQHSLTRSIILHLAPGAIFTAFIILAAPALASAGIDPIFALFGGIGLVLVPIELGYLALQARQMTGSWSPLNAVEYKERVPPGRLALLAGGLVGWFFPRAAGVHCVLGSMVRRERVLLDAHDLAAIRRRGGRRGTDPHWDLPCISRDRVGVQWCSWTDH